MTITHVHIFGGGRGIGRWFADHVFADDNLAVSIYDVDIPSNPPLRANINGKVITYLDGSIAGVPPFSTTDAIILAVPVSRLEQVCSALFPHLPDHVLVCDLSSVKKIPHAIMQGYACGRFEPIGIHPLFGPLITSPIGQTIIFTNLNHTNHHHLWFYHLLKSKGFIVSETTPEQHDEQMLYVQVLTHFLLLVFAKVLADKQQSLSKLFHCKTPPFTFLSAFAGRIIGGNAQTYAQIQRLEGAEEIRASIIRAVDEMCGLLGPQVDLATSVHSIKQLGERFTGAEIAECVATSGKATDALQQFDQHLFALRQTGQLCGIIRLDKQAMHVGIIKEIVADRILFQERTKQIDRQTERYAVCINETTQQAYESVGITFGKFRTFELLKRNIKLLSDTELRVWLERHALTITRDINVRVPVQLTEEFYEQWLPRLLPEVSRVTFVNSYRRKGDVEKVTLTIEYRPEITLEQIIEQIEHFLSSIAR